MGLKLCIVTIYNGNNYGAALQAYALWKYLEEQGHEVVFLNTHARDLTARMKKKIESKRKLHQRRGYFYQVRKRIVFGKVRKLFPQCEISEMADMDAAILGSDEIWNVKEAGENSFPCFFGKDLPVDHIISYAPSVSQSKAEDFKEYESYVEAMNAIEAVSVRDGHSEDVIRQLLPEKTVVRTVDPTLLHERQFYENLMERCRISGRYILIYSYKLQTNRKLRKQIEKYAGENGLKTVSVLEYLGWCDKSLVPSIGQTLTLFDHAEAVVTDTYHGCLLSIIFQKEFLVMSARKNKVSGLLDDFSLCSRIWSKERKAEDILNEKIDYDRVNLLAQEKRRESEDFLKSALGKIVE